MNESTYSSYGYHIHRLVVESTVDKIKRWIVSHPHDVGESLLDASSNLRVVVGSQDGFTFDEYAQWSSITRIETASGSESSGNPIAFTAKQITDKRVELVTQLFDKRAEKYYNSLIRDARRLLDADCQELDKDGKSPTFFTGESDRVKIAKFIEKHFSIAEIDSICFEMTIESEEIRGSTKSVRVQDLVKYCERRGRLADLEGLVRNKRNGISWV
jgi:hypothetical protein